MLDDRPPGRGDPPHVAGGVDLDLTAAYGQPGGAEMAPHLEDCGVGGAAADVDAGHLLVMVRRPPRHPRAAPCDLCLRVGAGDGHHEVARRAGQRLQDGVGVACARRLSRNDDGPGLDGLRGDAGQQVLVPPTGPARRRPPRPGRSAASGARRCGTERPSRRPGSGEPDPGGQRRAEAGGRRRPESSSFPRRYRRWTSRAGAGMAGVSSSGTSRIRGLERVEDPVMSASTGWPVVVPP